MNQRRLVPWFVGLLVVFIAALIFRNSWVATNSAESGEVDHFVSADTKVSPAEAPKQHVPSERFNPRFVRRGETDLGFKVSEDPDVLVELGAADMEIDSGKQEEPEVSRETWADPVNQKVLGDKRWMAEPSLEEMEHIDSVLNSPMPRTHQGVRSRATTITEMKIQIDRCLSQFPTGGRVIVVWELEGNGTLATARDVRFGPVVDVQDPQFLDCVSSFTPPPTPTEETFRMTVEYPAFLNDL